LQVQTVKVQCQICGEWFDAPKHRAHLMKYCPPETHRDCRNQAKNAAVRKWWDNYGKARRKKYGPFPYIKNKKIQPPASERHCRMCGRDPSPNYFYCPLCHHKKLNTINQLLDDEYVYLNGQKHGECFC